LAIPTAPARDVPLTWRCGVDNSFGWITEPDGCRRLCELYVFWFVDTVEVVCLHTGQRLTIPADGSRRWQPIPAAEACAIVGLDAPAVDGRAELDRRTDPFHIERRRSGLFIALVSTIYDHALPVGHALRHVAAGRGWDGIWGGATHHAPEVFAAAVNRRSAATSHEHLTATVRAVLRDDMPDTPPARRDEVLASTGWERALALLPAAVADAQARIPQLEQPTGGQLGFTF
jgi:hypothetical protein